MAEPITPERIAEISRRLPSGYATPWTVEPWYDDEDETVLRGWLVNAADATVLMAPDYGETLARWAASARTDVPDLLAEVERLRADLVLMTTARDELGELSKRYRAERDQARADAKQWHDTYQQETNARDEFFGELLELLPGAQGQGMDAYDQIPRGIEALRVDLNKARLSHDARLHEADKYRTALERLGKDLEVAQKAAQAERVERLEIEKAAAQVTELETERDQARAAHDERLRENDALQVAIKHRTAELQAALDRMQVSALGYRNERDHAVSLLNEAHHLRRNGERAPGGNETWRDWDLRASRWLCRDQPDPKEADRA